MLSGLGVPSAFSSRGLPLDIARFLPGRPVSVVVNVVDPSVCGHPRLPAWRETLALHGETGEGGNYMYIMHTCIQVLYRDSNRTYNYIEPGACTCFMVFNLIRLVSLTLFAELAQTPSAVTAAC